jgi:hypothetical protein
MKSPGLKPLPSTNLFSIGASAREVGADGSAGSAGGQLEGPLRVAGEKEANGQARPLARV